MELGDIIRVVQDDNQEIFVVVLSDQLEIPFRLPGIMEARRYQRLLQIAPSSYHQAAIFQSIFEECCCDKELANGTKIEMPAGVGQSIAQLIMWLSGYGEDFLGYTRQLQQSYREQMDLMQNFMKRKICSIFHGYTFEDIEKMNYQKLVEVFTHAEKILLETGIIKEEYDFKEIDKEDPNKKVNIEELMKQDKKDLRSLDGPPQAQPLQRGQRPSGRSLAPSLRKRMR